MCDRDHFDDDLNLTSTAISVERGDGDAARLAVAAEFHLVERRACVCDSGVNRGNEDFLVRQLVRFDVEGPWRVLRLKRRGQEQRDGTRSNPVASYHDFLSMRTTVPASCRAASKRAAHSGHIP